MVCHLKLWWTTGASINVIDQQTYSTLCDVHLKPTQTRAFAYNQSEPVSFMGKFDAVIETKKANVSSNLLCCERAELW